MTTNNSSKFSYNFICDLCNYSCKKKGDYNKHLQSKKHKNNEILHNTTANSPKFSREYVCNCGKIYKHHSSLYNHKKKCNNLKDNEIFINEDKIDYKTMFLEVVKKNNEFHELLVKQQQQISELIPKVGNNNNNINNKNKFNINVFLNEKCKDALSMDEFINNIEISMKNLLTTKEKGQTQGISNIIIENMNKLSLYERPLHCTDKKRETLYVKNQEWEKDENKEFINKALKSVESKQLKNLNVWLETHPNYMNNPSEQEEFAKLMSECGKSVDEGKDKIIKKVCDNVYIEKED